MAREHGPLCGWLALGSLLWCLLPCPHSVSAQLGTAYFSALKNVTDVSFIYTKGQTTSSPEGQKKENLFSLTSSKANLIACYRTNFLQNDPLLLGQVTDKIVWCWCISQRLDYLSLFMVTRYPQLKKKTWKLIMFKIESKSPHLQIIKLAIPPQEVIHSSGKRWMRSWEAGVLPITLLLQLCDCGYTIQQTLTLEPQSLFPRWPQKTLPPPSFETKNEFPDPMTQFYFD